MNWHDFSNKRILGTVPVEADGSAHFTVPSGRFVYFQLLDADKKMIQSMRSGTTIQSGEMQGCTGCHEERRSAPIPAARITKAALRRAPSAMNGWFGPERYFNYYTEVQPVFDRKCAKCHDFGKDAGKKLVLAGDRGLAFNASYTELWRKKQIKVVGGGPAPIQPAYSWGSHASALTKVLDGGHKDVKLSAEERERVLTWMDINAPYYPTYMCAYPANPYGRSPLDRAQLERLAELGALISLKNPAFQISFDRPELSPCLAALEKGGAKYREALAILQEGKEALQMHPEADAPGFQFCEADAARDAKYEARQRIEKANRDAVSKGKKMYDAQ